MYISAVEDLRNIAWAKSYLWDARFVEAPAPFDAWFPAHSIEEDLGAIRHTLIQGPLKQYKVPTGSAPLTIRMSFFDDESRTLTSWLSNWIKQIVNCDTGYVQTITEVCRTLQIQWLNSQRMAVRTATYLVFPDDGTLTRSGSSESNPEFVNYSFHVARLLEDTMGVVNLNGVGDSVSNILGNVVGGPIGSIAGNVVQSVATTALGTAVASGQQNMNNAIGKIDRNISQNVSKIYSKLVF
jgi:hypothetical protein